MGYRLVVQLVNVEEQSLIYEIYQNNIQFISLLINIFEIFCDKTLHRTSKIIVEIKPFEVKLSPGLMPQM